MSFRQRSFFASTRNLFVIPTEKFFHFDEESPCHSDREVFFFDEESSCHSDREVFTSTRNPIIIPTEKFFSSTRNLLVILTEKFFCFDEESLCFRQAKILQSLNSSFRMTLTKCHSKGEVFLLRRGISLSFRMRSSCFDEESLCHSDREIFTSTRNLLFQQVTFML